MNSDQIGGIVRALLTAGAGGRASGNNLSANSGTGYGGGGSGFSRLSTNGAGGAGAAGGVFVEYVL